MEAFLTFFYEHKEFIFLIILSIFLGVEVIANVPAILHTPLMSGANAIHGVVIIGAIIVMGHADDGDFMALTLGFLAVVLGTLNVVGGFVVTDRMLDMFKKKPKKKDKVIAVTEKVLINVNLKIRKTEHYPSWAYKRLVKLKETHKKAQFPDVLGKKITLKK